MGGTLSTTAEDLSPADGAAWCKRIGLSQYGCRVGEASLERVRAWSSGFGYEETAAAGSRGVADHRAYLNKFPPVAIHHSHILVLGDYVYRV